MPPIAAHEAEWEDEETAPDNGANKTTHIHLRYLSARTVNSSFPDLPKLSWVQRLQPTLQSNSIPRVHEHIIEHSTGATDTHHWHHAHPTHLHLHLHVGVCIGITVYVGLTVHFWSSGSGLTDKIMLY